ncbi:hypothetical protein DERF_009520 [Dermatophagoides farinae]|uniref:Uncharacterized protein n=1 Tax=Dermatophagoides farinae TaxID=6954 RepID=A0A922HV52_DERFA|nr:hypothetical protein DERF_009520 [Dermatophagoides farinae]
MECNYSLSVIKSCNMIEENQCINHQTNGRYITWTTCIIPNQLQLITITNNNLIRSKCTLFTQQQQQQLVNLIQIA